MMAIERVGCSCGGEVVEVAQTQEEFEQFNCPMGCCGLTLQCAQCKVRFNIKFEAPEME